MYQVAEAVIGLFYANWVFLTTLRACGGLADNTLQAALVVVLEEAVVEAAVVLVEADVVPPVVGAEEPGAEPGAAQRSLSNRIAMPVSSLLVERKTCWSPRT